MAIGGDLERPLAGALVLGIGNLLWADEGFGVRAVESFHATYELPEVVELLDGGTQGMNLLEPVVSHAAVLVFDAIDFGLPPGTLRVLRDREVRRAHVARHPSASREVLPGVEQARYLVRGAPPEKAIRAVRRFLQQGRRVEAYFDFLANEAQRLEAHPARFHAVALPGLYALRLSRARRLGRRQCRQTRRSP